MMNEKTSVLIISFNGWHYLDKCLASIFASRVTPFEIVVVDNASIDGTPQKTRQKYPEVRLFENSRNIGHVKGANQGFKIIKGDRILLLDADTELSRDALQKMTVFLDRRPEVSMVAPMTLNTDGSVQEGARRFPTAINSIFGRQSLLTRLFPNNLFSRRYLARDYAGARSPYPVEQVGSCAMLFRRSLLDEVGPFDEGYKAYFVDSDWCKRIQEKGKLIYCVPQAIITHHDQNSGNRKKNPSRIILFHKSAYRFYKKHYTSGFNHPKKVLAAAALVLRAIVILGLNALKSPMPDVHIDALSKKENARKGLKQS